MPALKDSPHCLIEMCKEVGMDCAKFYFYHCDLGPGNIIVNEAHESCDFVPLEWIRTKFRVDGRLDFPGYDYEKRVDWRRRVRSRRGRRDCRML
jgi:hypothetical protein